MLRLRPMLLAPLALLFCAAQGNAAIIFSATLTGSQENPPVPTTAFGTALFTLNDDQTALSFEAFIVGIDVTGTQTPGTNLDNLTAAHIHAPGPPGVNANVVWGFFGSPFNDNMPNDFQMFPFTEGVGGVFRGKWDVPEGNGTTLTAQLPNILAGLAYINFHTMQFGGGEIRGQILQEPVPEPTSLILLGAGLLALTTGRRWLSRR